MRALVFDCDGVLAETERDGHRVAFNQMFVAMGIDVQWDAEEYADKLRVAGGRERLLTLCTEDFVREHGLPTVRDELEREVARWHRLKTQLFVSLVNKGRLPAREGVRRLAESAHAEGWHLGVASTSAEESVRAIAQQALGDALMEDVVVIAGDAVAHKKPAPDVYLAALQRLEADAHACVAVEDSHIGVSAACAAGMAVVATQSHYTENEDLTAAGIIVSSLGEPGGPPVRVAKNSTNLQIEDCVAMSHIGQLAEAGVS
jgi:HAD superfamily hydrolase (TIGR01509 family)